MTDSYVQSIADRLTPASTAQAISQTNQPHQSKDQVYRFIEHADQKIRQAAHDGQYSTSVVVDNRNSDLINQRSSLRNLTRDIIQMAGYHVQVTLIDDNPNTFMYNVTISWKQA